MAIVAAVALAAGSTAWLTGTPERVELSTVDYRFSLRGTQPPSDRVAVVGIDDKTFGDLQVRWPFPRSLHAKLVDRLTAAGVDAIVYDVQFTEPTDARNDNALIESIAGATGKRVPVVLATEETDGKGGTGVLGGDAVLADIGARAANSAIRPDSDGVWRRVDQGAGGLDSLAVAGARAMGAQPEPLPPAGALIDFAGPPETIPAYSFSDVVEGRVGKRQLAGRTVVVGAVAPTLQDVHASATSGRGLMSGPEIWANAIATVEDGTPLNDAPWPLDLLLIALMAAAPAAAGLVRRPLVTAGVGLAAGALLLVSAQLLFDSGLVVTVVYPLIALAVAMLGTVAVLYALEAFERQRVHDTFARFVAPEVIDSAIEQSGSDLRSGAASRDCTIMFTDLRGFTTFSESRNPEEVLGVVNRYLSTMTETIMAHGGSIVSYMGDGIMAVFGAPVEQPDHADRALAAGREMVGKSLDSLNEWASEQGMDNTFRMGVGINSGRVMVGLVGSEQRVEFTTIGDATNTASRIESMTKEVGRPMLLSEATRSRLSDGGAGLESVGSVDVRGRAGTIELWTDPA